MMRSAFMPGFKEPVRWSMPSTRAPSRVAMATTVGAAMSVGSAWMTFSSLAAVFISRNISRLLLLAQPSVPSPTLIPAWSMRETGAQPEASFILLWGVIDHLAALLAEDAHILFIQIDAMKGNKAFVEAAETLEIGHGALSELVLELALFRGIFEQMQGERRRELIR
jgi:hypothetical protein